MNFKNFSIVILFNIFCFTSISQNIFPKNWEGNYAGELEIYSVDSVQMRLPMKLEIVKKTDSIYQWKIMYEFNKKIDVRNYELIVKNLKQGHFVIDELNSILIDSYFKNGIFTSFFEVMNSYIISTYTKNEDTIVFEIISGDGKKSVISGNTISKNDTIPEVKSYLVNGRQKAILKKVKSSSN